MSLVLASSSPFRRQLMENAGLSFIAEAARIDERAIEAKLGTVSASETALVLAKAKALDVASRHPGDLVIGSDQTMSLGDQTFHKPSSLQEARNHLETLSGRTHQLNSAVAMVRDGAYLWEHVAVARLTVRPLSRGFIDDYLERAGPSILSSVGAYQLEGLGLQLFDRIEGDYFTILGLPMLPLLAKLRDLKVIHA